MDSQQITCVTIQAWQGKVPNHALAPQHAPYIHFWCTIITYLEHDYSAPHFWAKAIFNEFLTTFSNTLLKQVLRRMEYFVFNFTRNCKKTNNPRVL